MSKQFKVNLSPRDRFDVFGFLIATFQPKGRDDQRKLKGVFETFGLEEMKAEVEAMETGSEPMERKRFGTEKSVFETGSVDLNNLLEMLDKPGATALGGLSLLAISDELLRAKEQG